MCCKIYGLRSLQLYCESNECVPEEDEEDEEVCACFVKACAEGFAFISTWPRSLTVHSKSMSLGSCTYTHQRVTVSMV